jgi:predicted O-methyltransferase YrrM
VDFEQIYRDYIATVSSADMALSWEALTAIAEVLKELRPSRILEYGSGISTCLLAHHCQATGGEVVSFDSDPEWAERTRAFLHERGLDSWARVEHAEDVTASIPGQFVLWDFDRNPKRVVQMSDAFGNVAPQGIMYVDDMQNGEIAEACAALGGAIVRETARDSFGRFGVFVQRPEEAVAQLRA